ncbi:RND family efflux transporter, MFP subunit [Paraburkholderia fungorum]|uniref:RND family efflux transporter, MFP subunit n=1 Tax=Paraburkholderia fungorum TaxID=134537 RepID=A0A1H1JKF7_9BURK|nr:efflux RND transporter periplasmic adaptor subunit [Paraburkholderia fungorum]SDR50486.1 RND family efflux transporter, MFP subunit [Paraburkholderia fungorum]
MTAHESRPAVRSCVLHEVERPVRRSRIVIVLALAALSACGRQQEVATDTGPRMVQLVPVTQEGANELREFTGRVEQTSISPLAFEVSGRVVQIAVLDGGRVRKGQLIARIDPEPYELVVRRAEAQYTQLADDLKRKAVLHNENILSGGAFDQLKAAVDVAGVQRDLARRDLRNTRLIAPFDGRIARRTIETQQMVQAGAPVFNLENAERIEIGVELPQSIAESLPLNNTLHAEAWTPDRPDNVFPLVYREHSTQSSPISSSYRLLFSVKQPTQLSLLPGMAMRVRIGATQAPTTNLALSVPVAALSVTPDGKHRIWRYDPGSSKVHAVPVDLREIRDNSAIVAGDLHVGDKVVGGGSQFVAEGQAVRPLDENQ